MVTCLDLVRTTAPDSAVIKTIISSHLLTKIDDQRMVQMDPKKDFAEATQGCKEVKSSAKHRIRKS